MGKLDKVALSSIRAGEVALRDVDRTGEEYLGLVDSIRNKGFFGAITVRPATDDETGEDYLEIVDGLHRFTAACDAGLEEINVDIVNYDEDQVLEAQLMANVHKIETKPAQYAEQLKRMLTRNPLMTESELASKLGKSSAWISARLRLNRIENETIRELIDEGKIGLSNAYALAKLPADEHQSWVEDAMTLPPDQFIPKVTQRQKEIREANQRGEDTPQEFQPTAYLQKVPAFKAELSSGEVGGRLTAGLSTPAEGFHRAIEWALHLDPESVQDQKAKAEQKRQEREERAEQRKRDRAAAKAKRLSEEAEKAQAEAEALAE